MDVLEPSTDDRLRGEIRDGDRALVLLFEGLGADEENSEVHSQLEQLYESDESDGS